MILLLACAHPSETDTAWSGTGLCEEASARLGVTVCTEHIDDQATWDELAVDAPAVDQVDAVKYLVPIGEQPLPTVFVNSEHYALHYDFLREAFPEEYGLLAWEEYVEMLVDPDARAYWGGDVTAYVDGGEIRHGFLIWEDPELEGSTPDYEAVLYTWRQLQARFGLGDLMFVPITTAQSEAAATWTDAPFPIRGEDNLTYEVYNPGDAFGTVRFVSLDALAEAEAAGSFGWQDIVVLDEAPMDLERVVSGVVTGTRQGALSHLNVRAAARGTPNCYTSEPWTRLAAWEGQLVHLECGTDSLTVAAATTAEAEAWWADYRPDPVVVSPPDTTWTAMEGLLEADTSDAQARATGLVRYGAKGNNLAVLYQRIPADVQLSGFLVPFAWYADFMATSTWEAPTSAGIQTLSFAETITEWAGDETFRTDAAVRAERLAALQAAMRAAPVAEDTILAVEDRIVEVFGGAEQMVRLRSSSNAEDGLVFSGAGLYDSESACVADGRDGDGDGPSACDGDKDDEHTVEEALRVVWSSLWNSGAWEERDWYGIDPLDVGMAVLVNDQSEDEQANVVAFTGHPSAEESRWLVEAQLGDLDVVSAEPDVWPEEVLLTVEDGEVTDIERRKTSSEAEEVLADAQLGEVGALLWSVDTVMPRDDVLPDDGVFMWDTEQKFLEDGRLVIKQVRPFLRD